MSKLAHSDEEAMDWVDRQLSMDDDYRHKDKGLPEADPPPFITALKNGGTKEEAIFALERMWEEQCGLRAEIEKLRGVPQEQLACDCGAPTEGEWADKHTVGCASLNMTCPFCGGPSGNIAAEYVTCGAAWNPDCHGHQVKAPTDANNYRVSTLWNTRP